MLHNRKFQQLHLSFSEQAENLISSVNFARNDILKIIQNFDSIKAHGHVARSNCIIKISGESITKPPQIIFKSCFENDICCNE